MFDVPNVTIASKCCLEDSEWKPPFEAGIVITNFAFNGDESTPHLHMTFVPYSDNCSRGQKTQNALAQTFTRMGYKTTMEQARDALDELWCGRIHQREGNRRWCVRPTVRLSG